MRGNLLVSMRTSVSSYLWLRSDQHRDQMTDLRSQWMRWWTETDRSDTRSCREDHSDSVHHHDRGRTHEEELKREERSSTRTFSSSTDICILRIEDLDKPRWFHRRILWNQCNLHESSRTHSHCLLSLTILILIECLKEPFGQYRWQSGRNKSSERREADLLLSIVRLQRR